MIDSQAIETGKKCLAAAKSQGAAQAEVYIENGKNYEVTARDGEVETLKNSESLGLGLRLFVDGRLGFGYTSNFDPASVDAFVGEVVALTKVTAADPHNQLPGAGILQSRNKAPETFDDKVASLSPAWAVDAAITMEKVAKGFDPRIKTVSSVGAGTYQYDVAILNSLGLLDHARSTYLWAWAGPYAADDAGNGQVAYFFDMKCFADELATPEEIANEAARRVTARLGADKIDSGHMPVVFSPEMAAGLAGGLAGAANGDMVFKQASFLHDKLGASIAPANFSLIDDPLKYHGTASGAFDGEGVPTRRLPIIEAGKLNLFLYDTYTASKAGTRSTGSAARSYSSLPRIGTSNLYIAPGDVAPEKIVGDVKKGLYVTSMMGRGVDTVTGDYSRGAQGFLIENGELTQPVQEVTVAGNLLEMLPKIDAIGSDLTFRGSTGAPTLRVAEMTVSGR